MNKWEELYKKKKLTREEMAKQFKSGNVCVSTCAAAEPVEILDLLAERALKENLNDIYHYLLLPLQEQKYLAVGMENHIKHVAQFISGFDREAIWEGRSEYLPAHYSQVPMVWQDIFDEPDIFYCTVSAMDKHGYFSFGTAADLSTIRKRAKKILLEVNKTMPRTFGSVIHISEIDGLIESKTPITEVQQPSMSEKDKIIGELIAERIPNRATIQLGIGAIPNAVAKALKDKKDLGIHSEMFCDSMVELYNKGIITNAYKKINTGKSVVTFTFGSRETYDFIDDNPAIEFLPVEYVNDPKIIARNDNFISINSCVEVDLFGQVCSETIGPKNFSGTGGQIDFIRGAAASKGGKSFLAFKSSAKKGTISKIKPVLTYGSCVTTTRNDVDYIVTEYGVAHLKGKTCSERARALISIAHPDFREELTKEAQKMHLIF